MNISSAILHIVPGRLAEAREALLKLSGLEIHAESPEGKWSSCWKMTIWSRPPTSM